MGQPLDTVVDPGAVDDIAALAEIRDAVAAQAGEPALNAIADAVRALLAADESLAPLGFDVVFARPARRGCG